MGLSSYGPASSADLSGQMTTETLPDEKPNEVMVRAIVAAEHPCLVPQRSCRAEPQCPCKRHVETETIPQAAPAVSRSSDPDSFLEDDWLSERAVLDTH